MGEERWSRRRATSRGRRERTFDQVARGGDIEDQSSRVVNLPFSPQPVYGVESTVLVQGKRHGAVVTRAGTCCAVCGERQDRSGTSDKASKIQGRS